MDNQIINKSKKEKYRFMNQTIIEIFTEKTYVSLMQRADDDESMI